MTVALGAVGPGVAPRRPPRIVPFALRAGAVAPAPSHTEAPLRSAVRSAVRPAPFRAP